MSTHVYIHSFSQDSCDWNQNIWLKTVNIKHDVNRVCIVRKKKKRNRKHWTSCDDLFISLLTQTQPTCCFWSAPAWTLGIPIQFLARNWCSWTQPPSIVSSMCARAPLRALKCSWLPKIYDFHSAEILGQVQFAESRNQTKKRRLVGMQSLKGMDAKDLYTQQHYTCTIEQYKAKLERISFRPKWFFHGLFRSSLTLRHSLAHTAFLILLCCSLFSAIKWYYL